MSSQNRPSNQQLIVYKNLLQIGLNPHLTSYEVRKVQVLNLVCFIGILTSLVFLVMDLVMFPGDWGKIITLFLGMLALGACVLLQAKERYFWARLLIILMACVVFYIHSNYVFIGFYGEYNYLVVPVMALFFFESKWIQLLFLGLSIALFYIPNYFLSIYPEPYFGYSNVAMLFVAVFFMVRYFKRLNQRSEKALAEQKELAVRLMEQKLLQSQLNPHFIFNALEVIQRDVLQSKPQEAAINLAKFCKLMRQTLEHTRQDFISLEDEIDALQNYVATYQLTLKNKVDFSIDLDFEQEGISVPPMFIQPFIENALVHGLKDKVGSSINLIFSKHEDYLQVQVNDNGSGLSSNAKTDGPQSLATLITQERFKILNESHNTTFDFSRENIVSENGAVLGVRVMLKIPYQQI
jgi:hypothetical protein